MDRAEFFGPEVAVVDRPVPLNGRVAKAVAGPGLVKAAYAQAEQAGYLGHEFGDSCLLLRPA